MPGHALGNRSHRLRNLWRLRRERLAKFTNRGFEGFVRRSAEVTRRVKRLYGDVSFPGRRRCGFFSTLSDVRFLTERLSRFKSGPGDRSSIWLSRWRNALRRVGRGERGRVRYRRYGSVIGNINFDPGHRVQIG